MTTSASSNRPFSKLVDNSFVPEGLKSASDSSNQSPPLSAADFDNILKGGDQKRLKACLRDNHWPADHGIRRSLWHNLCRALHKEDVSIYQHAVGEVFGEDTNMSVSLPPFVDPTKMFHYHLSDQGIHVVKRVVCVIGHTSPDITYGPGIFPLTSLLLHYMDEEDCYNCMCAILRSRHSQIAQTKIAYESTKFVLKDLARKFAKSSSSHMTKQEAGVETILEGWFWWIFHDLPFPYLVRIVDCFLYEGPKVFYRFALAILQLFHKHTVKNSPKRQKAGEKLEVAISQFCEDIPVSVDKLFRVAFRIRGLSRKEIENISLRKEMYVKSIRNISSTNLPHMTKSASCDSLKMKVSRSYSGPIALSTKSSDVLDAPMWHMVWGWLPSRVALNHPELLYTTSEHGTSLVTFFDKVQGYEPVLIIVKTTKNEVIGAYCSTDWEERHKQENKKSYFGTGETFLFSLSPSKKKFDWAGLQLGKDTPNSANLFQRTDMKTLSVGGGGGGDGLKLDENLLRGWSQRCDTFNNDPLVDGGEFTCSIIEVFAFKNKDWS